MAKHDGTVARFESELLSHTLDKTGIGRDAFSPARPRKVCSWQVEASCLYIFAFKK